MVRGNTKKMVEMKSRGGNDGMEHQETGKKRLQVAFQNQNKTKQAKTKQTKQFKK